MIRAVASREIKARGRSKSYLASTVALLVLAVGLTVAVAVFTGDDEARTVTVGTVAPLPDDMSAALDAAISIGLEIELETVAAGELEQLVIDGDIDAGITDERVVVWSEAIDSEIASVLIPALGQDAVIAELAERGVDRDGAAEVLAAGQIESRLLEPPEDSDTIRNAVGFITAIVTFMMIQIYGSFVAMGVIEEKSSRVIEILLAHLRPRDLLAGKIIGIGVLALAQTVILIGGLIAALSVTNDITIPADAWLAVPVAAVWLVLGFTFYASLLAAAGSLVSRTEDAQQVMLPVIAPLLVGYFVGVTASGSSDSILVVVLSHLPFTSPTVMPMRVAQGGVPSWEIGLSVVLLCGGIVAMLRVAGRIYEYSLLRTGSRVAWRDAFGSLTTRSR